MKLNWDDARIFLAIARTGTLTAAAQSLGLGIATISRRLDRLEQLMPMALFSRHQTGYRLTDDGEALLVYAEALETAALNFNHAVQAHSQAEGMVRLAVAENLANRLIIPSLQRLYTQHPRLRIEINTATQLTNLHRRDADMAIRTVRPEVGNLTIKSLGKLRFGLYASADYLKQLQQQQRTQRTAQAQYIGWAESQQHLDTAKYLDQYCKGRGYVLQSNSLSSQIYAIEAGLGIGLIPRFIAEDLALIRIDEQVEMSQPIWLAVHSNLNPSQRIRAVVEHLTTLFEGQQDQL
ncbi:LysR family transcriptional regulator [Acinetobacter calcoaceticus]|uniref:LysR family transcriptional regulator n=1 Tax=Acinetobacter calcoaceticus TaxID=471 RepID=A0A4R1XM47_ACICA|nr:LysR family transcriptional regulator [Acinetobacter calcoaceticus]